ncbi:MAG: hypothetical protein AVDCRST_MAG17-944, partial [uncultured Solirubrobacterales bacterium]
WPPRKLLLRGRVHGRRASFRHRPARHFSSAGRSGL